MRFAWDERKNEANMLKHGIDFRAAVRLFDAPHYTAKSRNPGSDTARFIAIGQIHGRVCAVIYARRGGTIRIISARRARHGEEKTYRQLYQGRG